MGSRHSKGAAPLITPTQRRTPRASGARDTATANLPLPIALTIPEAVRVSGCSRTAIYDALKRGDLTARKAGRRTLISFAELQAFFAGLPPYRAGA